MTSTLQVILGLFMYCKDYSSRLICKLSKSSDLLMKYKTSWVNIALSKILSLKSILGILVSING